MIQKSPEEMREGKFALQTEKTLIEEQRLLIENLDGVSNYCFNRLKDDSRRAFVEGRVRELMETYSGRFEEICHHLRSQVVL